MFKSHPFSLLVILFSLSAFGSATRIQQADSLISSDGTKSYSLPTATDTLAGLTTSSTFTNKTITSPTINAGALSGTFTGASTFSGGITLTGSSLITDAFRIENAATTTKQLAFFLTGQTASTTLTFATSQTTSQSLAVPNVGAADSLVTNATTATLTNKTISGASNTLSQIPVATQIQNIVPTGTVNGSNTSFTLSPTPAVVASVQIYQNGILLIPTTDYAISGSTITMVTAPALGQALQAVYSQY